MTIKDERYQFILEKAHAIGFRAFLLTGVAVLFYRSIIKKQISNDLLYVLVVGSAIYIAAYFYYKKIY